MLSDSYTQKTSKLVQRRPEESGNEHCGICATGIRNSPWTSKSKSKSGGEGRFKLLSAIRHLVYVESTIISGTRIKQNKNILPTPFLSYSTIRYEYFWFELIQNNQFLLNPSKVFSGILIWKSFSLFHSIQFKTFFLEPWKVYCRKKGPVCPW